MLFVNLPFSGLLAGTEVKDKKVTIAVSFSPLYLPVSMFESQVLFIAQFNIALNGFSHLNLNGMYYTDTFNMTNYGYKLGIGYRYNFAAINRKTGITGLNGLYIGPVLKFSEEARSLDHHFGFKQALGLGYELGHQWVARSGFTFGIRVSHLLMYDIVPAGNGFPSSWDNIDILCFDIGWSF